jgi:hypothetical protein
MFAGAPAFAAADCLRPSAGDTVRAPTWAILATLAMTRTSMPVTARAVIREGFRGAGRGARPGRAVR